MVEPSSGKSRTAPTVEPPPRKGRTARRVRRLLAVVVGLCAPVGAVRLVVPATAGTTGEPPGSGGS